MPGRARTKGSLDPVVTRGARGKVFVYMRESVRLSKPWRLKIIDVICRDKGWVKPRVIKQRGKEDRYEFDHEPYSGPVEVRFEVRFAREFSIEYGVTTEELREASATAWPISIGWGDGDKLERNLFDALTQSGLIKDDRLVVACTWRKRFCCDGEPAGLHCRVTAVCDA